MQNANIETALNFNKGGCFVTVILTHLLKNGRDFAYDTFKCISMNDKVCILIQISLMFV